MVDAVDPVAVIGINPGRDVGTRFLGMRSLTGWYWSVTKPYRLGGIVGGNTAKRFDHLGALILAQRVGIKCQC